MDKWSNANRTLALVNKLAQNVQQAAISKQESLKVGLDLGTSSIVLVVVNEKNQPVFAAFEQADVVRDGLVVNYIEALHITKRLKKCAE
jgi:ethanolamine utilization protein EutJ